MNPPLATDVRDVLPRSGSGAGSVVLSLFPGIGFLDRAFEEVGYCVVRGPDVIWGGDVKTFHAPGGVFEGLIGGPPCQIHSILKRLNPRAGEKHGDLIPEFARVVSEAAPRWFVMENVPAAPNPVVPGYVIHRQILNNRWLGEVQERTRAICFGTVDGTRLLIEQAAFEALDYSQAVTSSCSLVPVALGGSGRPKRTHGRVGPACGPRTDLGYMLQLQGFPPTLLDECPLTSDGKRKAVGNGVPLSMGRAIAQAVVRATKPKPQNPS